MINMSKNRKNLIQRVAMTLLALVLTSASAWAAGYIYVGYLDPTAPIGMQRKTVLNPVWVDDWPCGSDGTVAGNRIDS